MRVGFAGTPGFAATALDAIVHAGFDVALVLTQPDRPKGRGLALQPSEVKLAALRHGLTLKQPASLKSAHAQGELLATPLDVLVVAAYGLILPAAMLAWPRSGAINIHASLLPRWRGAAPIQRAILAGDAQTGITIMQMDAGLDTGPIIATQPLAIDARETSATLLATLARIGSDQIVQVLQRLAHERVLHSTSQTASGATYAAKIERPEAQIDWTAPAQSIDRQVRAFDPAPGAYTFVRGEMWKVWRAEPYTGPSDGSPGTVIEASNDGIVVACASGALRVHELQPAASKRVAAGALVAGRRIARGDVFGAPAR